MCKGVKDSEDQRKDKQASVAGKTGSDRVLRSEAERHAQAMSAGPQELWDRSGTSTGDSGESVKILKQQA